MKSVIKNAKVFENGTFVCKDFSLTVSGIVSNFKNKWFVNLSKICYN